MCCAIYISVNVTGDVLGVVGCGRDVEWCADMVERFYMNYGAIKCGVMSVYVKCGH